MSFIVTECKSHGVKVTDEKRSADIYRDMASECVAAGPHTHENGISCWECCPDMRIGEGWENDLHKF